MSFPVFDAHCDTAYELYRTGALLGANDCHISLERMERIPGSAQFFAFWTADPDAKEPPEQLFRAMYDELIRQFSLFSGRIRLCRTADDAKAAAEEGRAAAFLSIEGAEAISCDPEKLQSAYDMGIRMITLTWNENNPLAGSHITGEGLSDRGRAFVREAQRLGMLVDVSHLSERAFWDIADITEGPIVASHSNARAVCPHSRNLTDAQFCEIVRTGGFAGLNLYAEFLGRGRVTAETVADHALHFLQLGGAGHIVLGGDLDGCDRLPEGFDGFDSYPLLARALLERGVDERTVRDIFYDNLIKVVRSCSI